MAEQVRQEWWRTDQAKTFWAERYGRPVTDAELEEFHRNLLGFTSLLLEYRQEELENLLLRTREKLVDLARPNEVLHEGNEEHNA